MREGFLAVEGGRVWYGIEGESDRIPLLLIHGGPGYPHDYLEPLGALTADRPVIYYDQLGCGKSDRPADSSLWTLPRFLCELAAVRSALAPGPVHLYAHSWGTMLAADYLLRPAAGIVSVTLASAALSAPRWLEDTARQRAQLPPTVQMVLEAHEAAGTTSTQTYRDATTVYYQRHLCRTHPFPDAMNRSHEASNGEVYEVMWGPSEFFATGLLKDYDRTGRLHEIRVPVLLTCGRFDEATPETSEWYRSLFPNARLAVFESSAHMPQLEEPGAYLEVLRDFLEEAEAQDAGPG
jgi:proline iminopeptidase